MTALPLGRVAGLAVAALPYRPPRSRRFRTNAGCCGPVATPAGTRSPRTFPCEPLRLPVATPALFRGLPEGVYGRVCFPRFRSHPDSTPSEPPCESPLWAGRHGNGKGFPGRGKMFPGGTNGEPTSGLFRDSLGNPGPTGSDSFQNATTPLLPNRGCAYRKSATDRDPGCSAVW